MLSMLLLLTVASQAAEAPRTLRPATVEEVIAAGVAPPQGYGGIPGVIGVTPSTCRQRVTPIEDPTPSDAPLMWRNEGPPVALYRLLDRYVDGCPAPIIVNYRVPGSNAVGRELGRTPRPLPSYTPLTIHVP